MSTLSVCCITRGPTARVAAQLALLRDVAEEIVVAVDDSVGRELVGPLDEVADQLVLYPYLDPVDRPVGWVHSLCTRDWIFWVDDDEIPSAALIRELRDVLADPDVTHCFVPRRTLWLDAGTVLQGPPWVPDFQLRLVQNDPRLLWFPGITHWPIEAIGPRRYLEAPLYHADLLLNPLERRRGKVRRYESAVPGRRVAGLPMNDAYFLPEDREHVRTAPLADEDRSTLERLVTIDPWPEPGRPPRRLRTATRDEVDAHWHGAPATDELYRARLDIVDGVDAFAAGEERGVTVRVENRGSHVLPHGQVGWPRVRVSYRWLREDGGVAIAEGLRTPLPAALPSGEALLVPVDVIAPRDAGRYVLALDLVHEHVRWFGCEVGVPVDVRPAPRVAILAADEALAAAAAAALAELAPGIVPILLAGEPGSAEERFGYAAGPVARPYLLGGRRGRVLARSAALVADALLLRARRRPRFAAAAGAEFLGTLGEVDALLVVGDAVAAGRRETWARATSILAGRAAGVDVVTVGADDAAALPDAIRKLIGLLA